MAISNELRKLVDPNNECCCEHCLSSKCKEWAFKQGYVIISGLSCKEHPSKEIEYDCIIEDFYSYYEDNTPFIQFFDTSEPEAIFKACQWILDQISNQNKKMVRFPGSL